jgi:hypothetical protein
MHRHTTTHTIGMLYYSVLFLAWMDTFHLLSYALQGTFEFGLLSGCACCSTYCCAELAPLQVLFVSCQVLYCTAAILIRLLLAACKQPLTSSCGEAPFFAVRVLTLCR